MPIGLVLVGLVLVGLVSIGLMLIGLVSIGLAPYPNLCCPFRAIIKLEPFMLNLILSY